jgi:hypothetical protein
MIDTVLNLVFRCSHRRLTRPVTAVSRGGVPQGGAYVVCLDCGKQFAYDTTKMHIGKPLEASHPTGVLHPETVKRDNRQLKLAALWASIPLAVLIGSHWKSRKSSQQPNSPQPKESNPAK